MAVVNQQDTPADEPHDVLAAEEFAMPTRDERRPSDPSGIHEPHDVLAAEEFAMPAAEHPTSQPGGLDPRTLAPAAVLGALLLLLLTRSRKRRR